MIKLVILLAALGLVQVSGARLHEPHPDCPPAEIHFLLPHETDCTKFYYCEYGMKFIEPTSCAPGTAFLFKNQTCVHPWDAECNLSPGASTTTGTPCSTTPSSTLPPCVTDPPTTVNPCATTPGSTDPCWVTPTTAAPIVSSSTFGPNDFLENGCPKNWSIHQLLPHESNCSKFYYCNFGDLVERECPSGLHFNPDISVCDWPWNVTCDNNGGGGEGGGGDSSSSSTTTTEDPCEPPVESSEEIIIDDPTNPCSNACNVVPWPHETDCDKFWLCNDNQPQLVTCALGLHFNAYTYTCDFVCSARCTLNGFSNTNCLTFI